MTKAKKLLAKADAYVDGEYNPPQGFNCQKLREIGNKQCVAITKAYCAGYKQRIKDERYHTSARKML